MNRIETRIPRKKKKNYPDRTQTTTTKTTPNSENPPTLNEAGISESPRCSPASANLDTQYPTIRCGCLSGRRGRGNPSSQRQQTPLATATPNQLQGLDRRNKRSDFNTIFHPQKKSVVLKANSAHQHIYSCPSLQCIARIDKNTQRIGRHDQTPANATEEDHVTEYTRLIPNTQKTLHLRTNPRAKGPK